MRISRLLFAWLIASAVNQADAQNWPQFRGPAGDGLTTTNHPQTWSAGEHLAWKTKIPGLGWSQPIVWGDKLFVTTAAAEGQQRPKAGDWSPGDGIGGLSAFFGSLRKPPNVEYRWKVLCLNLADGKVIWERDARVGKPAIPIHARNSYATETPVTDGERVIASFGPAGVYCFDASGKLLWNKHLGTYPMQMDWGTGSSPVLHEELVFVQCDNDQQSFLVALDKRTGDEVWRAARDERSNWCTPYVWKNERRTELVTGGGGKMRAYEPATGKLLWEIAGSGRCAPSPVGDQKLLYVDSADRLTGQRGILAAIRPGAEGDISLDGDSASSEFVAWSVKLMGNRAASPLLIENCLYLLEQQSGIIRCLDAQTGKQHYRQRLPGAAGMTASPWASGGKIFCLDQTGQTFALAVGPELKVLAKNKLDDELFWSSPAIAGDALLLRGIDHLYCIR
jgi:outer membrane protein assembly factor BamB